MSRRRIPHGQACIDSHQILSLSDLSFPRRCFNPSLPPPLSLIPPQILLVTPNPKKKSPNRATLNRDFSDTTGSPGLCLANSLSLSLSLLFPSSRSILSEQRKSRFSTLPSNNFAKRNQINHDDEEDEEEETTDDATLQQEQKRPPAVCLPVIWPLLGIPHHENLCWNSLSSMWLAWVRRGVSKWVSE